MALVKIENPDYYSKRRGRFFLNTHINEAGCIVYVIGGRPEDALKIEESEAQQLIKTIQRENPDNKIFDNLQIYK